MNVLAQSARHVSDYRDELEHQEVVAVLGELPEDHPARVAYFSGSVEGADTIGLTLLMPERMDLVARLKESHLARTRRIWNGSTGAGHFAGRQA